MAKAPSEESSRPPGPNQEIRTRQLSETVLGTCHSNRPLSGASAAMEIGYSTVESSRFISIRTFADAFPSDRQRMVLRVSVSRPSPPLGQRQSTVGGEMPKGSLIASTASGRPFEARRSREEADAPVDSGTFHEKVPAAAGASPAANGKNRGEPSRL